MGEQSRSIDSWIRNPDFIQIHLVSLAEELPMTESVELYKQLLSEFKIKPQFYLNKITDLNKEDLKNVNPEFKEDLEVFIENEKNAIALLEKNKISFVKLPLIATIDTKLLIKKLGQELHV
jgi:arsenate reductase-like glutaredoxin family protein